MIIPACVACAVSVGEFAISKPVREALYTVVAREEARAPAFRGLAAALAGRTEPVARFARDLLVRIVELSV